MSDRAKLEIRIRAEDGKPLEGDPEKLAAAFVPHLAHVARCCADGYVEGEITDESFGGWWIIKQ